MEQSWVLELPSGDPLCVCEHLVFDRFPIVKLVNTAIDETRRGIQRLLDTTGRKFLKGKRYLLLRGKNNLTPEQTAELEEALKFNEPLFHAHYLKEELRALWAEACG
jgi:transposase